MTLDNLIGEALGKIPYFGENLSERYFANPQFQRFIRYGGWIAVQFWLLRAPLVWLLVSYLPEKINIVIHTVPSYLVADFIIGLLLAVAGFVVSDGWIWKSDEV